MLLDKYFSNRNQMTIDDLFGNSLSKEEMIEEGYRLANKEIGYRIEHLNNIAHHMEAKKWNIYLTVKVKFSPRIYIIDSVKFAKVFKLAIGSNSKNFFTQLYSINY